jgi:hypothetical protein
VKLLLAITIAASTAVCQQAQIEGLVRDPAGLNVSGAEISVRNEQTGGRRQTRTNDSGFYSVASLNPGPYRILIRSTGFETIVREGVKLEVGDNARLDFALRIGDSQTIVTVHGGPPLMNTEDASIGTVIGRDFIDEMPLNGRGIQSLIELTPGVEAVPVIPDEPGQFSVNGQRSASNYFTVDGVSANFGAGSVAAQGYHAGISISQAGGGQFAANNLMGTFSNLVSPDALQEFRIQTSTFAPEFGRAPGAQVGLITRSGTNRYSGALFEYFRNDFLDANDWFSNLDGLRKSPLRFNNFGATLAGPARIPHLYRGDDHTFFFFSFEALTMRQPQPTHSFAVPTAQTRLSESPLSALLYNALPLPDLPAAAVNAAPGWAGFAEGFSAPTAQQTWGLRLDRYFGYKLIGFFRYSVAPSNQHTRPGAGLPLTEFDYAANTVMLTAGLTQSISPALVNELRANFSQQTVTANADYLAASGAGPFPANLLFPQGYSPQNSTISIGDYSSPSIPTIQMGFDGSSRSRQFQIVDQLSYTRGTHQFKFGVDYRLFDIVYTPPGTQSGYIFTDLPRGTVANLQVAVAPGDLAYRVPAFSAYAQDTWHALRRLTITYGLRWELEPAPHLTRGDVTPYSLSSLTAISGPAPPGTPFYPTHYANFAPRIGVAWQMLDHGSRKTVFRAGTGVFYDSGQSWFASVNLVPEAFYSYPADLPLGALASGAVPSSVFIPPPSGAAATPGYALPRVYEWNATLEQSIGDRIFSASYTGAAGRRLAGTALGSEYFGSTVVPAAVYVIGDYFSSSYSALQLQFSRRAGKRVQALVSYTWSHSIDNLSNVGGGASPPFGTGIFLDPNYNRGDSDFDVRQSLHGALFVALPSPRSGAAGALLRNWTASTIFFARTALPTDLLAYGYSVIQRPDIVPGEPLYLYGGGYPGGKSFNAAAFTLPPNGVTVGDLGRNALRGFGAWQADLAVHREFRLTERAAMQLRAEAFNVFNHPNFANFSGAGSAYPLQDIAFQPGWAVSQTTLAAALSNLGTLGQLNQLFQVGGPRSLQLALRLSF